MQAYDGASVISGRCTDVQKKVMEVVPQAAYRTWSCWTVFFLVFFFYGNRFMQQQRSQEDSYIHKRLIANINLGPCTKTKTLHNSYICI